MKVVSCPESDCKGLNCHRLMGQRYRWTRSMGLTERLDSTIPRGKALQGLEQQLYIAEVTDMDGKAHMCPEGAEFEVHSALAEFGSMIDYYAMYSGAEPGQEIIANAPPWSEEEMRERTKALIRKYGR